MSEILLGVIIALTQIAGYYYYYLSVKNGVRPNTTSWSIWTFGSILNLVSYMALTGDWVKNLLPMACAAACVVLYVNFLFRGKFQKLSKENIIILTADIIATILWYVTDSALVGNILLQVSTVISYVPIMREVYDENENETQLPWLLWSVAYFLDIVLVLLRWEKWGDLVYPLTCFVLTIIVWYLIVKRFGFKKNNNKSDMNNNSGHEIESHLYSSVSKISGKGLYTSKAIKKGEVAFVMKGPKLIFWPESKVESMTLLNIVGLDKDLYISPLEPYVFINHRCEPNVSASEDGVTYIALKDIPSGSELTFDYSTSDDTEWEMNCSCGSPICRKMIRSIDKLPKEYFLAYYPHIPTYFQRRYIQKHVENNP